MSPPRRYSNTDERRAAVHKALEQHGHLSMEHRRTLAIEFACTVPAIAGDLRRIERQRLAKQGVPSVMGMTSRMQFATERDTALLRALGRLEVLTTAHIKGLIFPDTTIETARTHLNELLKQGFVWSKTTTLRTLHPPEAGGKSLRPSPKAPFVFGLTHEGKALLESLDAEPHAPTYALLKSRDRRAPEISQAQLTHDLLASDWCCSAIDAARRCPLLVDIHCHVEYVSAYDNGKEQQRLDAYIALRFTRTPRPQTLPGWWIPWYDGDPTTDQHKTVRFALEVDRSTEKLAILMGKALMYRTLTANEHYAKTLGGPVLPVILAPPGRRAGQIAQEWKHGWPQGAGVISTPKKASHPTYGVLWGEYLTLTDTPTKPYTLLGSLFPSAEAWGNTTRTWVPGTPTER